MTDSCGLVAIITDSGRLSSILATTSGARRKARQTAARGLTTQGRGDVIAEAQSAEPQQKLKKGQGRASLSTSDSGPQNPLESGGQPANALMAAPERIQPQPSPRTAPAQPAASVSADETSAGTPAQAPQPQTVGQQVQQQPPLKRPREETD